MRTSDGKELRSTDYKDVVDELLGMHKSTGMVKPTTNREQYMGFMMGIFYLMYHIKIRFDTPENFVEDLIKFKLLIKN